MGQGVQTPARADSVKPTRAVPAIVGVEATA
ncbi:hypothetical protein BFL35_10245 [Clavibacter michiganensis]|nr:hypothetical protein BFL35_10245 [Clavibacter michiganensis]